MGILEKIANKKYEKDKLRSVRNYNNDPKNVVWFKDWGELKPHCPACNEIAYEEKRCVFCGQPYIMIEKPVEKEK